LNADSIRELFEQVRRGKLSPDAAVDRLRHLPFEDLGFANVDHHRALRAGMPEVIFGPGKTPSQIASIFSRLARHGGNILATRASQEQLAAVRKKVPKAEYQPLARAIVAAGADGVILPEHRTAPLSAAALKASSGASEHLRLCRVAGLPSAIADIKRSAIWCAALDPRGEMDAWDFDLTQPVCVVIGGEGAGVHRLVRERCDVRLRLPMHGRVASLNASAAAAALLYEVSRQRARAGSQPLDL